MHDAFEYAAILERLPLIIESIATYDNHLLVGTRPGHLLVYSIKDGTGDARFEVQLKRSNKLFSKKPIVQLAVVPELNVLISLSDSIVSVHGLDTFNLKSVLNKTRGATYFAIDVQKHKRSTVFDPSPTFILRMCVSVRKKLMLFQWRNGHFEEMGEDLGVPDVAKTVAWSGDSLCVGLRKDYYLIKIATGQLKDLITTGKNLEPTISVMKDGNLILGRDEVTVFIDSEGKPTKKKAPAWTDIPMALEFLDPYMIGVLPKYVEIRTVEPRTLIQSIELTKPRLISHGKYVYVASASHVWRLVPVPIPMQISQLLQDKQFELALLLANKMQESESDKKKRIQSIQYRFAFELFCQKRFQESFKLFGDLETDPPEVIGLFQDLLPVDFRKRLEYPVPPPTLSGSESEKGCLALTEYLLKKRNSLAKKDEEDNHTDAVEGEVKTRKTLRQIIDTTLLKCYLQTNDALVAPFLRLENYCHPQESEKELYKNKKFDELIILYQTKGSHKKALDLLLRRAQKPGAWEGPSKTVEYLQRLGKENLEFILDYSRWVLKSRPEYGLKIFTEDIPEVESLPRDEVLSHIEQNAKQLVIPYLERILQVFNETKPQLHNKLVDSYRERISELMETYKSELPEGEPLPRAGKEPGELGELRNTLLTFLRESKFYQPQNLLTHFPDGFFEERALLLGRLGRHEAALAIYIHVINDITMASQYCKRTFNEEWKDSKDVYACLLHMYLVPPDASILGAKNNDLQLKPNVDAALSVLIEHYDKINPVKALELLPTTIKIQELLTFLANILEEKSCKRKTNQVLKSLLFAEHLQIQERRLHYQAGKVLITDERACLVCHKKIGTSAFARYPTGEIVHYYCYESPVEKEK